MKAGTFNVELKEEKTLWYDRKRLMFFGLPWTFTRYVVTESRLRIIKGFFRRVEDEIQLYRISDVTLVQTLGEKLCGTGTLVVSSSDASLSRAMIRHVKNPGKVKDLIIQRVEKAREEKGVSTSELVGVAQPPVVGPKGGPGPVRK